MVYTRGARDDFDRIASHTGDKGWSWDSLFPYILKNDRLVPSQDGHDITGQVDPKVHGYGPLGVSLPNLPSDLDSHVIKTTKELDGYDFNLDMNSGNTVGIGELMSSNHREKLLMDAFQAGLKAPLKMGDAIAQQRRFWNQTLTGRILMF